MEVSFPSEVSAGAAAPLRGILLRPAALQRRGAPSRCRLRGAGFCFKAREGISAQSLLSADQPGEGRREGGKGEEGGGVEIRAAGIK